MRNNPAGPVHSPGCLPEVAGREAPCFRTAVFPARAEKAGRPFFGFAGRGAGVGR